MAVRYASIFAKKYGTFFVMRPVSDRPGRPVSDRPGRPVFFTEVFCSLINVSNEKFSKGGGGGGMCEELKLVTLDGGLRKKNAKKLLRFLQK